MTFPWLTPLDNHCMKNIFLKTLTEISLFLGFAQRRKYLIFCKTKIKGNIIFSTISDSFRHKSIEQDNDKNLLDD